jgi:hypothetical protein
MIVNLSRTFCGPCQARSLILAGQGLWVLITPTMQGTARPGRRPPESAVIPRCQDADPDLTLTLGDSPADNRREAVCIDPALLG